MDLSSLLFILTILFFLFVPFFLCLKLFSRVKKCEEDVKYLKSLLIKPVKEEQKITPLRVESKTLEKSPVIEEPLSKEVKKSFQIPFLLKENWLGVFGSIVLVIGAVFFGLTANIMQQPEVRVALLTGISFLLIGIGIKLKTKPDWVLLSGWLKSIAGAVILFAALGSSSIEGLKFIENTTYAMAFLSFGILANVLLALTTPSQSVASFHVILSILTLCMVPQVPILLPLGAIVASVGLFSAYRSKWDLHLLLIVLAFSYLNTVWTRLLPGQMNALAIGCSLVVGLIAAFIHYSKKYQSPKLEVLPLVAHITNWGLLTWNIWLHAGGFNWAPLVLALVAASGFALARVAKNKGIDWLYYTDTLLSQVAAMTAIASLAKFSVKPMDIGLMIFVETLLFTSIFRVQKDQLIYRIGCILQTIVCLGVAFYIFEALSRTPFSDQYPNYIRMGVVAALSYAFHLTRNSFVDDFQFVMKGSAVNPISMSTLFGTLFLMGIYIFGFNSLLVQTIVLISVGAIAWLKKYKEDATWNLVLNVSLIVLHLINWQQLVLTTQQGSISALINFLGIIVLDVYLIWGHYLQRYYLIYALGIQAGLVTYVFTHDISVLIPGFAFLAYSLLALEIARYTRANEATIHVGLAFLSAFILQFVTVHLQIDPIWHGISLRLLSEILCLLTIVYWIAYHPRLENIKSLDFLVDVFLGFLSLSVFIEAPDMWRPVFWAAIAIGCIMYQKPKRVVVYSWFFLIASCIHVAFVTALHPNNNSPVFAAMALQLCYVFFAYKLSEKLIKYIPTLFKDISITVVLPIFLAIALFFAFNFEKTILTLLWVGLTCVYLGFGLWLKSKKSIQIAMAALVFCSGRLMIYDFVQSDSATRALVFVGVGALMLGMSILYKKFKKRIEYHDQD